MVENKNKLILPGEINSSVLVITDDIQSTLQSEWPEKKVLPDINKLQTGHLGTGDKQT